MEDLHWLDENLTRVFVLPRPAVDWLLMIYQAIQVFDDVADKDEVTRPELDKTIWNMLVAMHQNPFWRANQDMLVPMLSTMILKWQASDVVEREGRADAKSFVWRAGYYDLILMAIQLCHGAQQALIMAPHVMALYGEKFEDYMKEFENA